MPAWREVIIRLTAICFIVYVPLNGQADAIVFDSPVLLYYAAHEGKGKVSVVGPVFREVVSF